MVTTTVHLLRHGEVYNPEGVLYGRLPGFRLSDAGMAMADRIGETLTDHDIAMIVCSPLERTQQTAAPTAAAHGLTPVIDERIIEADNVFEGMVVTKDTLKKFEYLKQLTNPFRPSWGEPYEVIARRMSAAVTDAVAHAPGREILFVSHQLPIWTYRSKVEGRRLWHDPRKRQCNLASLTTFTFVGDEVAAVSYREPAADLVHAGKGPAAGA